MEKTVSYLSVDPQNIHILPAGIVLKQRYQIQNLLGQGGFGITYLGWDHLLQTPVAIKEFFPQSIVNRDCTRSLEVRCNTQNMVPGFHSSKQRFLREAQALEKFRDIPAIVGISDYFEENNTAYIVMEYVSGMNLKEYVDRKGGRLTVEETLKLLEPVFLALIHVHKSGLVHRDISPDNIMLSPQEGAKLLDFGAVRSVENPGVDKPLTHSTEAILKHGFAPIEQYNTRGSLGPWTDEYALCATIYYCVTGIIPESVAARISENISPAWSSVSDLLPYQRRALEQGMAIEAKNRFSDVSQLYEALYHGGIQNDGGEKTGEKSVAKYAVIAAVAALLLAICIVALSIFGIMRFMDKSWEKDTPGSSAEKPHAGNEGDNTLPSDFRLEPGEEEARPEVPSEEPEKLPPPTETSPKRQWTNNIMVRDPLTIMFGVDIKNRQNILSITFVDDLSTAPENHYNLGLGGTDAVVGWTEWNNGGYDVWIGGEGGIDASESCRELFYGCMNVVSIEFGDAFHTEGCDDMYRMFSGCHELRSLDVSAFDTSRVQTMQAMFRECKNLTQLDVSTFDTSRVNNMAEMFTTCSELEYIDLQNFDTSNVTNMSYMFSACRYLRGVYVSSFDTSKVTNMAGVFAWCPQLEDMTLSWDISSVTNYSMFMADGKTINGEPWQEYFKK